MARYSHHKLAQSNSGSSLSEVPPALFLLIFFALFPVINLILMGLTYCSCALLNNLELREAARTPNSQLPPVILSVQQKWQSTGLGQLSGLTSPPETDVTYNTNGADTYVTVSTVFTAKSILNIPFFKGVPGLGGPWTYKIAANSVLEDPSYASFKPLRRQSGQALIETVIGLVLLIPLALFSYDLTFVLICNQNNERLAENAARVAANHLTNLSAQQAAQQAVDKFNQSAGTNNTSLTDFSYDQGKGQITLTTRMDVKLPVPVASCQTITIQAQSIVPIVATPAPI